MPLTSKGQKILSAMQSQYGSKKGKSVFYASINKGTVTGAEGRRRAGGGPAVPLPSPNPLRYRPPESSGKDISPDQRGRLLDLLQKLREQNAPRKGYLSPMDLLNPQYEGGGARPPVYQPYPEGGRGVYLQRLPRLLKDPSGAVPNFLWDRDKGNEYAQGGANWMTAPWYERSAVRRTNFTGFLHSPTPGRTDKHNLHVGAGAYIVPADTVSAMGQNNSLAGAQAIKNMFKAGSRFGPRTKMPKFASGGAAVGEPTPVVLAGGEFAIPPEIVSRIGDGDLTNGHRILDKWVLDVRRRHINKLKSLPGPKQ